MQCTTSGRCMQRCFAGEKCACMDCDAKNCHQICDGGTCGILTCAKHDGRNTTFCEQYLGGGSGQLICEANKCHQRCISGNCTLTCTSNVKVCIQICDETCTMNCQAEECVPICRAWASCTVTTTVMPTISVCNCHFYVKVFYRTLRGFVSQLVSATQAVNILVVFMSSVITFVITKLSSFN